MGFLIEFMQRYFPYLPVDHAVFLLPLIFYVTADNYR